MASEVVRPAPSTWSRAYPPLLFLALAVIIAAFVLPSSLNLPQTNPSTVLEYAPVPPEDEQPNPPPGNLSSLGLGSSGTLSVGGQPPPPPPPARGDRGKTVAVNRKKCVGTPPRQTEDLAAPPCVPYFDGDNFGATYQGVTKDEITVLVYYDVGAPDGEDSRDANTYIDLDAEPPKPACPKTWPAGNPDAKNCDDLWVRIARAFNLYFNDRFQTYNRHVRYVIHYTGASSAADRRKDAQDSWSIYKPFAALDRATFQGHNDAYEQALAGRGVLTVTSETALRNEFFTRNAPLAWAFWPDVERWSALYSSYVCTKVKGGKVVKSDGFNGRDRVYGLWYTNDDGEPGLRLFAEQVKAQLQACGMSWAADETFSKSGFIVNNDDPGGDAIDAVTKFQGAGVTTVLYLGGLEGKFSQAADRASYYPEIVVAGDLDNDNNQTARLQNANVWKNSWSVSWQVRFDRPEATDGYRAYKEFNPNGLPSEARLINEAYRDHFMLFQAIQVAGPDLTPETVDKGFHAIPENRSSSPYHPALYFDPGDYTFVKDSTVTWWDPQGDSEGADEPGCYRVLRQGRRFRAGEWPAGPEGPFDRATDPCTSFEGGRPIQP